MHFGFSSQVSVNKTGQDRLIREREKKEEEEEEEEDGEEEEGKKN